MRKKCKTLKMTKKKTVINSRIPTRSVRPKKNPEGYGLPTAYLTYSKVMSSGEKEECSRAIEIEKNSLCLEKVESCGRSAS